MVTKGCWTCKDRKVACDRATPKCLKCMKSKRECGGYGVRLTWPQQVHNRAFVAHTPADHVSLLQSGGAYQWVNVVPTDICLHLATSASLGDEGKRLPRNQLAFPRIPEKIQTNLGYAATNDLELLHYCEWEVLESGQICR
ncbi:hypothetical protein CC86DRAFT_195514 [Ophiobolus disseminans]|uniref:Zn(2)-C6 fungal-type domain-containing protein n=1 Tax=Ophiobolus disseminans TaxID=1469910 RepID=A0A6A7A5M7_9PLEO|nr:hypothetical protein CC86DRAFT_195514 [Ophiobolus disseminans]